MHAGNITDWLVFGLNKFQNILDDHQVDRDNPKLIIIFLLSQQMNVRLFSKYPGDRTFTWSLSMACVLNLKSEKCDLSKYSEF